MHCTYLVQARLVNLAQHASTDAGWRRVLHRPDFWKLPAMAPPCHSFPVKELPLAVQANLDGRLRKTEDGRRIDLLRDCELLKLLQYECVVTNPELHSSPIQCWPVQRLFRRLVF